MTNYQNLDVWKKSMLLVKGIYAELKFYPKEEMYALISQTKRAAVSVPANIAEGIGRNYKKDTVHFLHTRNFKARKVYKSSGANSGSLRLLNGLITYYEKSTLK